MAVNPESNSDFAYLLGALFGDGCFYSGDRGRIIFSSSDKEFTAKVSSCIKGLFGLDAATTIRRLSKKNSKWKDAYVLSSRPLFKRLQEHKEKKVPAFVLSSDEMKAAFLKGLFDAEGNVDIHNVKSRNVVERHVRCFSNDTELLEQSKRMLFELGIKSMIHRSKGNNFCLTIWGYKSLLKFNELIGFTIQRKQNSLNNAIAGYKQIQTQWGTEVRNIAVGLNKKGIGPVGVKYELAAMGHNVPKPTIEYWIYKKR